MPKKTEPNTTAPLDETNAGIGEPQAAPPQPTEPEPEPLTAEEKRALLRHGARQAWGDDPSHLEYVTVRLKPEKTPSGRVKREDGEPVYEQPESAKDEHRWLGLDITELATTHAMRMRRPLAEAYVAQHNAEIVTDKGGPNGQ